MNGYPWEGGKGIYNQHGISKYQHLVFEQPSLPGSMPHVNLIGFNFCPEVRLKDGSESSCNFALLFLKCFS